MNADVEKLNAEIAKAADVLADYWRDETALRPEALALFNAVAAKRAAMQPKPLSAEEAFAIYYSEPYPSDDDMARVLAECRKRDLAVIEPMIRERCNSRTDLANAIVEDLKSALLDGRSA